MLELLLSLALTQPAGLDSTAPWEKVSSEDGVLLEKRKVEGTGSLEFRVTTSTPTPVDALCEAIFDFATRGKDTAGLTSRKELSSEPDERVVYDQFNQKVVSNRDYTITVRRSRPKPGECRIRFWATNDKGPKLADGWVRIEKLYGGWTFTPGERNTTVVYSVFVDPGGSVPSFFANGSQRDAALATVKQAMERGKAWKP